MRLSLRAFDGGTELNVAPLDDTVGMDRPVWNQLNFEESLFVHRRWEIEDLYRSSLEDETIEPWPDKLPGKLPIDHSGRISGSDGFHLNAYAYDPYSEDYPPIPAGEINIESDQDPYVNREEGRAMRALSWREVQARKDNPEDWVRLDSYNAKYGTRMVEPTTVSLQGHRGSSVAFELPDNSLYVPWDLRYPERYKVYLGEASEEALEKEIASQWLTFRNNGTYHLYLKPRRWRWYVSVVCWFMYATPFQSAIIRETFTKSWYDRPPVYPYRHSKPPWTSSDGDHAIEYQFETSRAAQELRQEILAAQWHTLCEVYVFLYNDPAKLTCWRMPPRGDEYVSVSYTHLRAHET